MALCNDDEVAFRELYEKGTVEDFFRILSRTVKRNKATEKQYEALTNGSRPNHSRTKGRS